jgi:hypothetical protein
MNAKDCEPQEQSLIERGILTPPKKLRLSEPSPEPPGNIPNEVMARIWREEREGR